MEIFEILSRLTLKKAPRAFAAATICSNLDFDIGLLENQYYFLCKLGKIITPSINRIGSDSDKKIIEQKLNSLKAELNEVGEKTERLIEYLGLLFEEMRIEFGAEYRDQFFIFYYKKVKYFIDQKIYVDNKLNQNSLAYEELIRYCKTWFFEGMEGRGDHLPELLEPLRCIKPVEKTPSVMRDELQTSLCKSVRLHHFDFHHSAWLLTCFLIHFQQKNLKLSFEKSINNVYSFLIDKFESILSSNSDNKAISLEKLTSIIKTIEQKEYIPSLPKNTNDIEHIFNLLIWSLFENKTKTLEVTEFIVQFLYEISSACLKIKSIDKDLSNVIRENSELACSELGLATDKIFICSKASARGYENLINLYVNYPIDYVIEIISSTVLARISLNDARNQLEQLLFEEYSYGIQTAEFPIKLKEKIEELKPTFSTFKNQEDSIHIDGSTGPQQALNRMTAQVSAYCADFGSIFRANVVIAILEKYEKFASANYSIQAICLNDESVRTVINNHKCLKSLFLGEPQEDAYSTIKNPIDIVRQNTIFTDLQTNYERLLNQHNKTVVEASNQCNQLKHKIHSLLENNDSLQKKHSESQELIDSVIAENEKLVQQNTHFSQINDELQKECHTLENLKNEFNNQIVFLRSQIEKLHRQGLVSVGYQATSFDQEKISKLVEEICKNRNLYPSQCLKLLEILSKGKVRILPEAIVSAEKLDKKFNQTGRLLSLLLTLVFRYSPKYFEGGDVLAKQVFSTNEYAAQDSKTTKNSRDASIRSVRTVLYEGETVNMKKHLKIGVSDNKGICLRIYFFMDKTHKCPVIGYCGSHPNI